MTGESSERTGDKVMEFTTTRWRGTSANAIALVLGWVNARDEHVRKYANALASIGVASVRGTMRTRDAFDVSDRGREEFAKRAIAALKGAMSELFGDGAKPRVYAYAMSNGGCWFVSTLATMALRGDKASDGHVMKFDGAIFDSSPAYMSLESGRSALTAGMRGPARAAMRIAFTIAFAALSAYHAFTRTPSFPDRFWRTMETHNLFERELYIYSANDALTDCKKLEELLDLRRANSARVETLKFEDSPHCAHLRKHHDAYVDALRAFIT